MLLTLFYYLSLVESATQSLQDLGGVMAHSIRFKCSIVSLLLTVCAALILATGSAWARPIEDGIAALGRGNYADALRIIQPLAAQGDAHAQNNLGIMYENGRGVGRHYPEALKWYRMAAAQGLAGAQFSLGVMHANGRGVARDTSEALKWYRLAATQGDARAQFNVGSMYDNGRSVRRDYPEAIKWYRLAAEQGDAHAQRSLGELYYDGLGVAQDYVRAYQWLNLSAMAGDSSAVKYRDIFAKRMTPQQIAEGLRLARECQQKTFKGCD